MDRYPLGSRTSHHAGRQCYSPLHVKTEPAGVYLRSYLLDNSAIAQDSEQTLPARDPQPRPDDQRLVFKPSSSHFSFMLLTERQTRMKCRFMAAHFQDSRRAMVFHVLN